MVIMVDAGAVALASAASTIENASDSPSTRYVSTNTSRLVRSASVRVMNITLAPFCLSAEKRKNWPVENAMKLSATSDRKAVPCIMSLSISFNPQGPMAMPASMYAVTSGRDSFLVTRVNRNPLVSIIATEIITEATGEYSCRPGIRVCRGDRGKTFPFLVPYIIHPH